MEKIAELPKTERLALGAHIRIARKNRTMTQKGMAKVVGTTYTAVQQWENGTTFPRPKYWEGIKTAIGIWVPDLVRGVNMAKTPEPKEDAPGIDRKAASALLSRIKADLSALEMIVATAATDVRVENNGFRAPVKAGRTKK